MFLSSLYLDVNSGATLSPINFKVTNPFILEETDNRVSISRVEFREHDKNSAIYVP